MVDKDKKDNSKKKIPGHMLAFLLANEEQKNLEGICERSTMSAPKTVKAIIKIADAGGKTVKADTVPKTERKKGDKKDLHFHAFRLEDDVQKALDNLCRRSELSRPKVVRGLIKMAEGKTLKPAAST